MEIDNIVMLFWEINSCRFYYILERDTKFIRRETFD